jgi:hypothetical protein
MMEITRAVTVVTSLVIWKVNSCVLVFPFLLKAVRNWKKVKLLALKGKASMRGAYPDSSHNQQLSQVV